MPSICIYTWDFRVNEHKSLPEWDTQPKESHTWKVKAVELSGDSCLECKTHVKNIPAPIEM